MNIYERGGDCRKTLMGLRILLFEASDFFGQTTHSFRSNHTPVSVRPHACSVKPHAGCVSGTKQCRQRTSVRSQKSCQHVALRLDALSPCLSLIHISEPTRRTPISYAVFCLKK